MERRTIPLDRLWLSKRMAILKQEGTIPTSMNRLGAMGESQ